MQEQYPDNAEISRKLLETFSRLHRLLHGSFFKSLTKKIRPSSLIIMMMLKKAEKRGEDGVRVSEIAAYMGISVSGVTQAITGLEKHGYIARQMSPEDRRAVLVSITEEGKKIMVPATKKLEDQFAGLVHFMGEDNSRTLVTLMVQVSEYFEGELPHC